VESLTSGRFQLGPKLPIFRPEDPGRFACPRESGRPHDAWRTNCKFTPIQPEFLIEFSVSCFISFSHDRINGFAADSSGYVVAIPATPHTRPTFQAAQAAIGALGADIWEWERAEAFRRVWAGYTALRLRATDTRYSQSSDRTGCRST
jgi:hypothetical protein